MSTLQAAPTAFLRIEREQAIARVTLDRPPLNVLNSAVMNELTSALTELAQERGIKALILTGAGRAFCAGVDVAEHTEEQAPAMLRAFHTLLLRLLHFPAPTIAEVNGAALGGGCELFLACDVAIAREDAKIGQPEIKLGSFPPFAAAVLPHLVGRSRALDLILSGRTFSGAEALAYGLVQFAVSAVEIDSFVRSYADDLSLCSSPVLRLAKRAVLESQFQDAESAVQNCEELYLDELMQVGDAHEGVAAFLEHRPPVWKEA